MGVGWDGIKGNEIKQSTKQQSKIELPSEFHHLINFYSRLYGLSNLFDSPHNG